MNSAQVFAAIWSTCVVILGIGVLWFFVARPILVAFGIVSDYADDAPEIMSSTASPPPPSQPSVSQTDRVQTPDGAIDPAARRQKLIDTFRTLRAAGMTRDTARPMLALWDIPLDHNLWTLAAPPDADSGGDDAASGGPRMIMMRDNGSPPRPVPVDPDFPYQPMEKTG